MLGILEFPVIPQPLWGISIGNSRALVIASEAKQSLGILDLVLGILDFLGVRGCLFWNSRIPYYVILGLDTRISVMRSPDQVGV